MAITIFPPCTASRVWVTQAQYDYYRECEERLKQTQPARAAELGAWLRDHYTPEPRQPEYINQAAPVIDCATGRPWQPGPRRRPAQLAPLGVRPAELTQPQKTPQAGKPRGWQEPIERIQPIRITTEPEAPAWLQALAIEAEPEPERLATRPKPRKVTTKRPRTGKKAAPLNVTAEFSRVKREA